MNASHKANLAAKRERRRLRKIQKIREAEERRLQRAKVPQSTIAQQVLVALNMTFHP